MAPFIEKGMNSSELRHMKYVRDGDTVAFGDPIDDHSNIAQKHKLGRYELFPVENTVVDDAGYITPEEDKLVFQTASYTCNIKGEIKEANNKTREVVKDLLGESVVY